MEFDAKLVKCPYYLENNSKYQECTHQIRCEGVDNVKQICLLFKSKEKKHEHRKRYCYSISGYHSCPVGKQLDERWEENNE